MHQRDYCVHRKTGNFKWTQTLSVRLSWYETIRKISEKHSLETIKWATVCLVWVGRVQRTEPNGLVFKRKIFFLQLQFGIWELIRWNKNKVNSNFILLFVFRHVEKELSATDFWIIYQWNITYFVYCENVKRNWKGKRKRRAQEFTKVQLICWNKILKIHSKWKREKKL